MSDPEQTHTGAADAAKRGSLKELAVFFLRLGVTAFGGPAAHIAIMEDELVRRRKWLSRAEKFLDLLGASSLIPGPSSSELAIHIGYLRCRVGGPPRRRRVLYYFRRPFWSRSSPGRTLVSGICPPSRRAVRRQAGGHCGDRAGALGMGRTAVKTWVLAIAGMLCVAFVSPSECLHFWNGHHLANSCDFPE